jgi:predicted PurR-regulated permease PerM
MKVPYALLLALLAGIFGMIPFGILVATVPAVILTLIHRGALTALYVLGLYWLLQQLTDYVIAPQIVRKATGLPSLMVIISLILSVTLMGFLGFFLAIPLALLVLEIVADTERVKAQETESHTTYNEVTNEQKVEPHSDFDINEFERKLVEKLDEE